MNWKIRFRELTGWRLKNDKEGMKNGEERWRISIESLTEAPQLGFSSRKYIFSPKTAEMHSQGVMNILKHPPSPIYMEKGGAFCPEASWGRFTHQLLSSPPFSYFTEKLRKPYGSVSDLIFIFIFSSLSPMLSEICLPKVFGNFTEESRKPQKPFFNNVEELAAQLLPP